MLNPELVTDITLFSNVLMMSSEILLLAFIVKWATMRHRQSTGRVLLMWTLVSSGYLVRIGYWAAAVMIGGGDTYMHCTLDMIECIEKTDAYPKAAIDNRWLLVVPALMVAWGNLMFVREIEGFDIGIKCGLFGMVLFVSTLPLLVNL